jgi:hypothetical protein
VARFDRKRRPWEFQEQALGLLTDHMCPGSRADKLLVCASPKLSATTTFLALHLDEMAMPTPFIPGGRIHDSPV